MGLLKEPLEVDFYVDPKTLSGTEEKIISDYIKVDKEKKKSLHPAKKKAHTNNTTQV